MTLWNAKQFGIKKGTAGFKVPASAAARLAAGADVRATLASRPTIVSPPERLSVRSQLGPTVFIQVSRVFHGGKMLEQDGHLRFCFLRDRLGKRECE
jgi:hypothetical protein